MGDKLTKARAKPRNYLDRDLAPILQRPTRIHVSLPGKGLAVGDKTMFIRTVGASCNAVLVITRATFAEVIDWRLDRQEHKIDEWCNDILGPNEIAYVAPEKRQ